MVTYTIIIVLFSIVLFFGEKALDVGDGLPMALLIGGAFLNYLAHFISLMVMRWRPAGKICAGDYLTGDYANYRWSLTSDKLIVPSSDGDGEAIYLTNSGAWLFYAIQSQFFFLLVMISGGTFYAGMEAGY